MNSPDSTRPGSGWSAAYSPYRGHQTGYYHNPGKQSLYPESEATSEYAQSEYNSPPSAARESRPFSPRSTKRSFHHVQSDSYHSFFKLRVRKGSLSRWFLLRFQISPYARKTIIAVRVATFLTTILAFIVHSISNVTPLNVLTFSEMALAFPTYLTPAIYSIIMWAIVLLAQTVSNVYMLLPQTYSNLPINVGLSFWPLINNILLISWIFSWLYQDPAEIPSAFPTVMIWLSLAILCASEVRLAKGFAPADDWVEYFTINMPHSMMLAWILAEALNSLFIGAGGWLNPVYDTATRSIILGFTIATIVAFGCMVLAYVIIGRNPAFGAIFSWSIIATSIRNFEIRQGEDGEEANFQVAVTSVVMGSLIVLCCIGIGIWNLYDVYHKSRATWRHTGNYVHV